jgi:GT2 family glycosyltransferase
MSWGAVRPVRVVVVVLHFRDPEDTLRCVSSLPRSTTLDFAVLVVNNGPADAAYDDLVARLGPHITTVATGSNLGYAGGNNVGIREALHRRPEFVWVINPDTVVEPTTLADLLATADAVGDAGIVGPRLVLEATGEGERIATDGGVVDPSRHGATSNRNAGRRVLDVPPSGPRDVDYVSGAALLLRRSMLESVGLLPEDYFLYFEETEYCRTVQCAGWRTVVDDRARMVHRKRSSGLLLTPYYLYYMTRNRLLFAGRHFGSGSVETLADLERTFLGPWRAKVEEHAPDWLPQFDALVSWAVADARAGMTGRQPRVDDVPEPVAASSTEVSS